MCSFKFYYGSLIQAIKVLLSKGPKVVVITSLELDYHDKLVLLAASKKG